MDLKRNPGFALLRIFVIILCVFIFSPAYLSAQSPSHGNNTPGGWSASSEADFPVKRISGNDGSVQPPQAREEKDPTAQFLVGEVIVEQGSLENYFSRRNNR